MSYVLNFNSPTWKAFKASAEVRRKEHIKQLVDKNNDEVRGRIKELDYLLALEFAKDVSLDQEGVPFEATDGSILEPIVPPDI